MLHEVPETLVPEVYDRQSGGARTMKRIVAPTETGADWKRLLAEPHHWQLGKSAMSAAACWEAAGDHLPPELTAALTASRDPDLASLELLLAVPEWKTALPGGRRESYTDVLALARNDRGLVVVAVEAKVDEEFGPTLGEKRVAPSDGQRERLDYLDQVLHLDNPLPDAIRYQLLHRTASAILTARLFHARTAVMLVQSFSPVGHGRKDFEAFSRALGASPVSDSVVAVRRHQAPQLFVGWCTGHQRFRQVDLRTEI